MLLIITITNNTNKHTVSKLMWWRRSRSWWRVLKLLQPLIQLLQISETLLSLCLFTGSHFLQTLHIPRQLQHCCCIATLNRIEVRYITCAFSLGSDVISLFSYTSIGGHSWWHYSQNEQVTTTELRSVKGKQFVSIGQLLISLTGLSDVTDGWILNREP